MLNVDEAISKLESVSRRCRVHQRSIDAQMQFLMYCMQDMEDSMGTLSESERGERMAQLRDMRDKLQKSREFQRRCRSDLEALTRRYSTELRL